MTTDRISPAIHLVDVTKRFGNVQAVQNVSFRVEMGEVVGLLGPNGAGKTTTMRMMAHQFAPTTGEVNVLGQSSTNLRSNARGRLGYLPENAPAYPEMSVKAFLMWSASIKQVPKSSRTEWMNLAVETCGLKTVINRHIGQLSKGYRQRVGLAQAMIHQPEILLLDEPFSGLDPNQIEEIKPVIRDFRSDCTVIFSSHILADVESLCDRVIILNNGKIAADRALDGVANNTTRTLYVMQVGGARLDEIESFLDTLSYVDGYQLVESTTSSKTFTLVSNDEEVLRSKLVAQVVSRGWMIQQFTAEKSNLGTLFRQVTRTP